MDSGFGFRIPDFGFWGQGVGFRVNGFGFRVQGLLCRVDGFGFDLFPAGGAGLDIPVQPRDFPLQRNHSPCRLHFV